MGIESKLKTGLYSAGREYVYKSNKKPFSGPYYKSLINDSYYAGKTYDPNVEPQEIISVKKPSYTSKDLLYDVLAGVKQGSAATLASHPVKNKAAVLASIQAANQQGFTPVVGVNPDADINSLNTVSSAQVEASTVTTKKRYFFRVLIALKPTELYKFGEVNTEEQYNNLKSRPNYVVAIVTQTQIPGQAPTFDDTELNAAEKKMPGLKQFLGVAE